MNKYIITIIVALMALGIGAKAQTVYSCQYKSEADVKVHVTKYNILHICGEPEYEFKTHVDWFKDYPADLINWSVKDNHFTLEEGRELYSSAILGGMNNKGNVLKGPKEAIEEEVKAVLDAFGTTGIMIGADCTIQGENISLDYIKTAVDAAHGYVK